MTNAIAPQRRADIVSPITDSALPNKVLLADARQAGPVGQDKPKPDDSA
ncbi:hypothetical protein [Burkholderia sp. SCN-KJ]|nr:hypothetical protein [Burkholderia sp. SCN-KJ]MCR4470443.1 hypothetical protein [Burkholderia sp. SCN-KJ]